MALKFLNKKGWHTGSLRNIENVWKAEQKHDAEQKKLEELRKQIQEERERSEFRLLQEQAGLVPKQERLEFLYDSGLAVGKGSSDGFKALESLPNTETASSSASKQQASMPGALFEEKPQSANDAWRKLHSDPLLMIRQREQEALAHIKNNPVQMAMIRKSVGEKKHKDKNHDRKEEKKPLDKSSKHHKHSSSRNQFDSENVTVEERRRKPGNHKRANSDDRAQPDSEDGSGGGERRRKKGHHKDLKYKERSHYDQKGPPDSEDELGERERHRKERHHKDLKYKERSNNDNKALPDSEDESGEKERLRERRKERHKDLKYKEKSNYENKALRNSEDESGERERLRNKVHKDLKYKEQKSNGYSDLKIVENDHWGKSKYDKLSSRERTSSFVSMEEDNKNHSKASYSDYPARGHRHESSYRRQSTASKLSEEERAARLREMQMDVELHEEQRRKRLRKADEDDVREASEAGISRGKNFLDATQKSVYGAEKGGSSTIEQSVRRRTHYLQGRSEVEGNAFRR